MATIDVRGMRLGEGMPKTIVPLMGRNARELAEGATRAVRAGADCLEWRADYLRDPSDRVEVARAARLIRQAVQGAPLLFTFRSKAEGGQAGLLPTEYERLCRSAVESGDIDMVDIELRQPEPMVTRLAEFAREHGVCVVVSHHDFEGTPPTERMVSLLLHAAELGAQIPKLAVMAQCPEDSFRLMEATAMARRKTGLPMLTMAMGAHGTITRLAGETFGSALTFCSVGPASAPGQVELGLAKAAMGRLSEALA